MNQELKDYAHLHFLVFLWGFTAILGLLITIPAVEVVFYRTLLSFLGLGLLLVARKRNFNIGARLTVQLLLSGVLFAGHWILFFGAARVSNASICLAGMATTSLWTALIEPIAHKRRVRPEELIFGILGFLGLYLIADAEFDYLAGLIMAIGSAFLAASFTVINGNFVRRANHYMIMFYEMAGAWIATLLFLPCYLRWMADGPLQLGLSGMDLFYLLILAWVCTLYAYSAATGLMKRLTPFAVNFTVNLEPVYGILLALLILGDSEKMQAGFYWGTLLILVSVLAYPVYNRYKRRKALETDIVH